MDVRVTWENKQTDW